MNPSADDRRIRLISQGYNTWKVQVLFSDRNLSAEEITKRLHEVKCEVANKFGVPDFMLQYVRLLGRQQTRTGLLVQMQITKEDLPAGAPVLRTKPMRLSDGALISDMILEIDLFPYDEFNHPLTRSVLEARIRHAGFNLGCLDWDSLTVAFQSIAETAKPVFGITAGKGTPPGVGRSSRITYGIRPDQEGFLSSAWIGLRPVEEGDFLVEVSLPSGGHQWGKNVYGREIEPKQGIQTRLEAGEGTQLWLRGTQLVARRSGLLIFQRSGRDKRDCDTRGMPLAKLVGHVITAETYYEPQVLHLDLSKPTAIMTDVLPGSRVRSNAPLFIAGNVEEDVEIECTSSLRIGGTVRKAKIHASKHCAVAGFIAESQIDCGLTLQADAGVLNSQLRATDVIGREIRGGSVEALRHTTFEHVEESGGAATAIRVNLRRFLESQHAAGRLVAEDLQRSIAQIVDIFGSEISSQVTEGTAQRYLLHWLRAQKSHGGGNFTHTEVQEFRTILEMVPAIRAELSSIGVELRDIASQLNQEESKSTEVAATERAVGNA